MNRWQHISTTLAILLFFSLPAQAEEQGFFLALGGINGTAPDGHKLEGQFGTIYISPDGENWQQVFQGGPVKEDFNHAKNNMLRCLTYGEGRFVATGNPQCVVVSEDGKNWEIVPAPGGSMSVEYGNGMFLAPKASHLMTSKDGLSWTRERQPGDFPIWGQEGAGHIRKTVFGNDRFVCIGEQRLGVTKDGRTWLHHEILPQDQRPGRQILLFGNGVFVWLCEKIPSRWSKDGIDWKPITFPDLPEEAVFGMGGGVFDGEKFLAAPSKVSGDDRVIYSSRDGKTWTKAVAPAGSTRFSTAGKGLLLENQGWSRSFAVSADGGKTWKQIKADVPSRKVYFFDGQRIIGQSGG